MLIIFLSVLFAASTALLVVLAGSYIINRQRLSRDWLVRTRLMAPLRETVDSSARILRGVEERRGLFDRLLTFRSIGTLVEDEARRAAVRWTANQFGAYVAIGVTAGLVTAPWLPWWFTGFLTVMGGFTPYVLLRVRRGQRERQVEAQIPEALDMLVSSIKAGLSLQAGMQFVGQELPAPVGPEFARFFDEQRLGIDLKQALASFQDRLGTVDARMVVLAITIQRETGGNLAEVLSSIASVIRERIKFRDQVMVLTAESKASAWMLSVLPVIMFFGFEIVNPDYMSELTQSLQGRTLLLYAVVSLVIGMLLLNKFSRIED